MPTQHPETWLALLIVTRAAQRCFTEITGMTLDEWDEQNYQRVMSHGS
jgi:hypothetical protein